MIRDRIALVAVLVGLGAGWGLTMPLTKWAVSTGYGHFGLIFWQLVIGAVLMGGVCLCLRRPLPVGAAQGKTWGIIALIGTVIPASASYQAIVHLPAGVMSVLLSCVPIAAFPIALALGLDRFELRRLLGLLAGLAGGLLLVLPDAALPDSSAAFWVPVAAVAGLCYAFEGNFVAKWGTAGMDPLQVMFGASFVGALIVAPLSLASGQWISPFTPFGVAEWSFVASSVIHVLVYAGYVWLVGRAGPTFAVQVSYLVTGFGVVWAMVLLGERYAAWLWVAMALMFVGLFLVQPRGKDALAQSAGIGDDTSPGG